MNPIDVVFQRLRQMRRGALIPFLPAGDPSLDATAALTAEVARRGASLIEVGFPYSDPVADGPVIQAAYTRALARGLRVEDIFAWARRLTSSPTWLAAGVPLVAMVSYTLVYRLGPVRFLDDARAASFAGAVVPDLPADEAEELARLAAKRDFKLVQLVTPTTPPERVRTICRLSTGFLYCVSVRGITGERDCLPDDLLDRLRWLRQQTDLPLCVGFGISRPEHVRALSGVADGVIVGSALVRHLEGADTRPLGEVVAEVGDFVAGLAAALDPST